MIMFCVGFVFLFLLSCVWFWLWWDNEKQMRQFWKDLESKQYWKSIKPREK